MKDLTYVISTNKSNDCNLLRTFILSSALRVIISLDIIQKHNELVMCLELKEFVSYLINQTIDWKFGQFKGPVCGDLIWIVRK